MIYEKLNAIQTELKAPKNQVNKFGGYNYRSCEDILEAVKPLLKANAVCLTLSDKIAEHGNRVYVEATATLIDYEGQSVSVTAYAREAETKKGMDDSQITGATSSYARKYALNGLFDIDDCKDADSTNTHGKEDKFFCEDCGGEIQSVKKKDGTMWVPSDMARYSTAKWGKALCAACMKKQNAG